MVSVIAVAAPASAATPGVTYVTTATLTAPSTTGYAWSNTGGGTLSSGLDGLTVSNGVFLENDFVTHVPLNTGTALVDLAGSSSYAATTIVALTPYIYFLPTGSGAGFVLYPVVNGPTAFTNPAALWQSTGDVGTILAGGTATLGAFDTQFATDLTLNAATIYGVSINNYGGATTLTDALINGTQYIFTPTPVFTAPTTLTAAAFQSTGITVSTSGFLPNEAGIVVGLGTGGSGGPVGVVAADAQGRVSYTYVGLATEGVGAYTLSFFGSVPNSQVFSFDVTAALAATGVELGVPAAAAFAALALGAVFLIARRRRTV